MAQRLISNACVDALRYYVTNQVGSDTIRKCGRAAGIIPEESAGQAMTSAGSLNSVKLRRGILDQHLAMLDLESPDDVGRFVNFCSFLLCDLPKDGADFQSISVPLEQCGWIWEGKKLVKRVGVSPEMLARRTPKKRIEVNLGRIDRDLRNNDFAGAASAAKDLIESVCRGLLKDQGEPFGKNDDRARLLKKTKLLVLKEIDGDYKNALEQLLNGLNTTIGGVFALRNAEGRGKGRLEEPRIDQATACLAVNTAITVCTFLTEYTPNQNTAAWDAELTAYEEREAARASEYARAYESVNAASRSAAQDSPGQCPACHGEILPDHNFCEECGASLRGPMD